MKHFVLFMMFALFCAACSKENDEKENEKNNPFVLDFLIKVTGVNSLPVKSEKIKDSLAFITRYAWEVSVFSKEYNSRANRAFGLGSDGEWLFLRDTINNKLMFTDIDVINNGRPGYFIVDYTDILFLGRIKDGVLVHAKDAYTVDFSQEPIFDTLAYIPNRIVLEAREKITKAFEAKNYEECQRLFNEAYIFIPTTGTKWKAMKEAGIE